MVADQRREEGYRYKKHHITFINYKFKYQKYGNSKRKLEYTN